MASMSGQQLKSPIELTGDTGSALYHVSSVIKEPGARKAQIFSGKTTWFVYNVEDYNQVDGVKLTILDSHHTTVNTDYDIKSIQGFDNCVLRIVLFDKKGNIGPTQNITKDTPSIPRSPQSLLVSGGKWNFYSEEDYAGPIEINGQVNIGPGIYDFPTPPKSTKISDSHTEDAGTGTIFQVPEPEKVIGVLELYGRSEILTLNYHDASIRRGYKDAKASLASPESVWVIYDGQNFADTRRGRSSIVRHGNGKVNFGSNIRSAQGYNSADPAAILFTRPQYRGPSVKIEDTVMDLTSAFPEGVSSVVITGGLWRFYTEAYSYGNAIISVDGTTFLGPGDYDFKDDANFPTAKAALFVTTKEYSCELYLGSGENQIVLKEDAVVLQPGYTTATASAGAKSIWVVYDNVYFDKDESGSGGVVIEAEKVPTVEDREIRSAQGFTVKSPSFVLFPLSHNRGYGRVFDTTIPYLENVFESSNKHAVSSVLVIGGEWSFFTGYNYTGQKIVIDGVSEFGPGAYNFAGEQNNIISSVLNIGT